MTFRMNYKGGSRVLKEVAAEHINNLAQRVAAQAGPDAQVETYTTDRAAASVSVPAAQQARDGVLTRAAAAVGLEVKSK